MAFAGQADITIDAKGRLAVPAKFRAELEREGWRPTWMCMPQPSKTIRLYPEATFDKIAASLADKLVPTPDEERLLHALFGLAEKVEADSVGRIKLSSKLLRLADMQGEVTVVGTNSFLTIHDRERWEQSELDVFQNLPELVQGASQRAQQNASS